jgi:hypothetical protein
LHPGLAKRRLKAARICVDEMSPGVEDATTLRRIGPINAFLTEASRQYVNGGCLLYRFDGLDPSLFNFAQPGGWSRVLQQLLDDPTVRKTLADVDLAAAKAIPPPHRILGSFGFEGALTEILLGGGAYVAGMTSEDDARSMSRSFVEAMLGDRRRRAAVFALEGAWTSWFHDVAWDCSYVIVDPSERAGWILLMTDTD